MTSEEERHLIGEKLIELAEKSKRLKLIRDELRVRGRHLEELGRSLSMSRFQLIELDRESREALDLPKLLALLEEERALDARVDELEKLRDALT